MKSKTKNLTGWLELIQPLFRDLFVKNVTTIGGFETLEKYEEYFNKNYTEDSFRCYIGMAFNVLETSDYEQDLWVWVQDHPYMPHAPKKIYLQVGVDFDEDNIRDKNLDYSKCTWHSERVFQNDIAYEISEVRP